ncbi:protein translocase subunit SecF [Candidatus Saganbacteria bacterium]|nr:protein translocase subunit SecF [Candidatus Saganbacteria bacterium]
MSFHIIKKTRLWFMISGLLIILSLGGLVFNSVSRGRAMNFGIDFTGGTLINIRFASPTSVAQVRAVLNDFKLAETVIQRSGENDIFIRTEPLETEVRQKIVAALSEKYGGAELLEADTIGPIIGSELRTQAFWALVLASLGIAIYVAFRFEMVFAVAALFALFHDAIITTGFMAILWRNIDITFIAALLTILGYSINDTIVIFDRVRENLKKPGASKKSFGELVNASLWETMARSINTVLTVVVMVLALLFFGGAPLREFCLTLLVGFTLGAYSSVFVASPLIVLWHHGKK